MWPESLPWHMALVTDGTSGGRRREALVTAEGILCTTDDGRLGMVDLRVDSLAHKHWHDAMTSGPVELSERNMGKTLLSRTQGTKNLMFHAPIRAASHIVKEQGRWML
ncbi:hypothetical protein BDA96_07G170600 [Sorghum bicolor]|uniref:Uncharacterized protein n=1 Tax=Sorghum bicolor TaxID=4558 RepID=A0A921QNC0_SORBI|nr:hypothetical protein BDA96_07G170600 [Sorghum bicolor]